MADLDIKRIVFESRSLKEKTFFALGKAPQALTVRRAEHDRAREASGAPPVIKPWLTPREADEYPGSNRRRARTL